jgi:hypothetical protein
MNVFEIRNDLIREYNEYITSFIQINDPRIKEYVDQSIEEGLL